MHQLLHDQRSSPISFHAQLIIPAATLSLDLFPASYLSLPEQHDLAAHKIVGNNQASHFLASQLLLPKIDDTKLPLSCTVNVASCFDSARHTDVIIYSQSLPNICFICPCCSAHKALIVWAEVGLESGIAQALRNTHSNSPTL